MIDEQFILRVERLRDDLEALREDVRRKYPRTTDSVSAAELRERTARLAEVWMVDIAAREGVKEAVDADTLSERSIEFQRLLTYAEHSTIRRKYDGSIKNILRNYRPQIIIPLKQRRAAGSFTPPAQAAIAPLAKPLRQVGSVFIGHSFDVDSKVLVGALKRFFACFRIDVETGELPKADRVSLKVRRRIEKCDAFVGLFTRRDKLSGKREWTTSAWVIDEKAYALAKEKKLILIKEAGISTIGGLQGDYEYLEFDRDDPADLMLKLLELFKVDDD